MPRGKFKYKFHLHFFNFMKSHQLLLARLVSQIFCQISKMFPELHERKHVISSRELILFAVTKRK